MSKPIHGYRTLTDEEVALINKIKEVGNTLGVIVDGLQQAKSLDQRWVSIGKTDLQKGIMALVRAVAQPGSF